MSDEAIGVLMPKILEAARLARYNPGFSGATLSGCELDTDGNVVISTGQTSGTVTEDIAVSSIAEWYKYHRKVTTPANTSVSCAVKDTSNNVLIASVADGDSLSAIDAKIYKTIRLVHTLARDSVGDTTPELNYREVSWLGEDSLNWSSKSFSTSAPTGSHEANTHLDITGSGYLVSLANNDYYAKLYSIRIDGGSIYKTQTILNGFPIRFNKSLIVKANNAADVTYNAWVVLD